MLALYAALKSSVTKWVGIIVFVTIVLAGAFRAGQKSTKAATSEKAIVEVATKAEIDAQVSGIPAAARRDELRKWAN